MVREPALRDVACILQPRGDRRHEETEPALHGELAVSCPAGKHDFWGKPGVHYHQGMKAGENTLNAICARLVVRTLARDKGWVRVGV
jgi:hypothetical protein